jgi:SAM-dependent methyltransferase
MARSDERTAENTPRRSDGTRQGWDRRYAAADRIHATPVPNRFLVAEISGLAPGAALDLACGAGRNAVWLAERGWRVTGVDFSGVALGIARELATSHGAEVEWIESNVIGWAPPARAFDLVCVLYLQLPAAERRAVLRHAGDALRPGGTLLVVGHDLLNMTEGWGGPSNPDVLFTPDEIAAEVGSLQVEKAERVRRSVEDGGVLHEAVDALVRARRP